jgi:hypothetical protein
MSGRRVFMGFGEGRVDLGVEPISADAARRARIAGHCTCPESGTVSA